MARYFITFSYDGSRYHGWQVQPNGNSVQAEMQRALATLLRQEVEVVGAGRTDAGVHTTKMVAHFDCQQLVDLDQLAYKLNRLLPRDIAVSHVREVAQDMHARFSATSRTYHYFIHTRKDPFVNQFSCQLGYRLDFALMNEAGRILTGYSDFGAFCKSHTDVKTTICQVTEARWEEVAPYRYRFTITANRFLRNMVRAVVGTMVDVGRGRLSLDEFRSIIESKSRTKAGESMPAKALFLVDVTYPDQPNPF
ncbi:MAG: tRNA pseudouridine(38-40) synthase TruA [Prevotella sp.]|nr:tRNA pseudouridine(38-40) synthase TruA [Prevotella sp.]